MLVSYARIEEISLECLGMVLHLVLSPYCCLNSRRSLGNANVQTWAVDTKSNCIRLPFRKIIVLNEQTCHASQNYLGCTLYVSSCQTCWGLYCPTICAIGSNNSHCFPMVGMVVRVGKTWVKISRIQGPCAFHVYHPPSFRRRFPTRWNHVSPEKGPF